MRGAGASRAPHAPSHAKWPRRQSLTKRGGQRGAHHVAWRGNAKPPLERQCTLLEEHAESVDRRVAALAGRADPRGLSRSVHEVEHNRTLGHGVEPNRKGIVITKAERRRVHDDAGVTHRVFGSARHVLDNWKPMRERGRALSRSIKKRYTGAAPPLERRKHGSCRASRAQHGDMRTSPERSGFPRQCVESANIGVRTFELAVVGNTKSVHRADSLSNGVHARASRRECFLVRDGYVAGGTSDDETRDGFVERSRPDIDRFVSNGQARVPKRGVMQRGRQGVCHRVSEQNETARWTLHDRPGARSVAMRSMA